jgi:hypothetical protein
MNLAEAITLTPFKDGGGFQLYARQVRASFPHLNVPDKSFGEPGFYEVCFAIDEDSQVLQELEDFLEQQYAAEGKGTKLRDTRPWGLKERVRKENQDPGAEPEYEDTGRLLFRVRTKAEINGKPSPPNFFGRDPQQRLIGDDIPQIGWGSVISVRARIKAVKASGKFGLSAYLEGVQLLHVVEPSGGGGFESEEDFQVESDGDCF